MSLEKGSVQAHNASLKAWASRRRNGNITPWNKGKKGCQVSWLKGLTKDTDPRVNRIAEHLSIIRKGRTPWNKGLTKEDSPIIAAYAQKLEGQSPSLETRAKLSQAGKGRHLSPEQSEKLSNSLKEYYQTHRHIWFGKHPLSKETRRKISIGLGLTKDQRSKTSRKLWDDPDFITKQMKARGCKPNKVELLLQKFLDKHFPNQWKYVGDGQVIIGGKCPDFVNINGKKQVIEIFGRYWHDIFTNPHVRLERTEIATHYRYSEYGFDCLVIWDEELKKPSKLRKKLEAFVSK